MELKTVMRDSVGIKGLKDMCLAIDEKIGGKITIIEIGSYMGESSAIFAEEFPYGKIICIDPWKAGYDDKDIASSSDFTEVEQQFDLRTMEYENIFKLKGNSLDYYKNCDVVYIDGSHKYEDVKADLLHWLPQTKRVICGHDYYKNCDVVYIDGSHKYEDVKADLLHWLPQTKRVICGHDYCNDEEFLKIHSHIRGVTQAVNEVVGKPDMVFVDNSWLKWL